jgi:hypothetical protein
VIAVDEKPKVDTPPNGDHVPESAVKSGEPATVEPAVDAPSPTPPLSTDPPPISSGDIDVTKPFHPLVRSLDARIG